MERDDVVRFDWAMKRMLRDKANFAVLEGLMTVLLGEKMTIVELLESEANQQTYDDKFNRVEIKARDSKGEIVIVEIQNRREIYFMERILYGVAKAITEHIALGDSYEDVKKIISISIIYFDLGKGDDYLYHGQNKFIGVHTEKELQISSRQRGALEMHGTEKIFPDYYLIKVNNFNKLATTQLDEWIEYLKTGRIDKDTKAPGLREARERLRYYDMDKAQQAEYRRHIEDIAIDNDLMATTRQEGEAEGEERGFKKGRAEGRAEGRDERTVEIARNMKALGLPIDQIAKATEMTAEEIEAL